MPTKSILIANIGNSDLVVKHPQFDYHLPIFDRKEPNDPKETLTPEEEEAWRERIQYAKILGDELGVFGDGTSKFPFREFTKKLLQDYRSHPDKWKELLRPARIGGVINFVKENYDVKDVYIFVTDQKPPQFQDSVYLFDILKIWFDRNHPQIKLHDILIEPTKAANDLDLMMAEYAKHFIQVKGIRDADCFFVSIKGGTTPMQMALQSQVLYANQEHLFIDPILSKKRVLDGEFSNCETASFWESRRIQKYQTVKLLLDRWDFDGGRSILESWLKTLNRLKSWQVKEVDKIDGNIQLTNRVLAALRMGIGYLNLDAQTANDEFDKNPVLSNLNLNELECCRDYPRTSEDNQFPRLLNLYAQCFIFWQVDRIADFLVRMGSFYEETLHELIRSLDGEQYFNRKKWPDDWYLDTEFAKQNPALTKSFAKLEKRSHNTDIFDKKGNWNNKNNNDNCLNLRGRSSKQNFVAALVECENNASWSEAWEEFVSATRSLDYWCAKRNQLIHSAKGVSKQRLQEEFDRDLELIRQGQMKNHEIRRTRPHACQPHEIRKQMTAIASSTLQLMAADDSLKEYLNPNRKDDNFYLYSAIAQWVTEQLDRDVT